MFKPMIIFLIATLSLISSKSLLAFPSQWESLGAEFSLYKIIHDQEGKIISTSTLSSDNGNSTQYILYIQTKKDLYRCMEFKDFSFTTVRYFCERLIKPEYEITYSHSGDSK
jgi:hypothetical protein